MMNWKADSDEAAENDKIEQDAEATAHALVIATRSAATMVVVLSVLLSAAVLNVPAAAQGMLQGFVQMMLDVFYPVCRDLLELQRLLREMLPKVVAAQLADRSNVVNGTRERLKLSHTVARPVLKEALQRQFYSVCAL